MAYPPPQQNQPPYGQQPPPYQQPPYGQQPPPYQQPPYGYPPQYPYQPPRNNSGAIIAVLVLILVIAGGVVAFLLLSNQNGLCNPRELAGTWRETNGIETLYITSSNVRAEGSGLVISGSYTCSGNTINWTLSNGQTTTLEILDKTSTTMQLRNALGMTSSYRKQ